MTDIELNVYKLTMHDDCKNNWLWLEKLIVCLPMYSQIRPDSTKRNKVYSQLMIIICIICNIVALIISPVYNVITNASMLAANRLIAALVSFISKLFQLHYFYQQFNYPWNSLPIQLNNNIKSHQTYSIRPVAFTKIMICALIFIQVVWIVGLYFENASDVEMLALYENKDYDKIKISAYLLIYLIFYEYPLVFTFGVHSAICIKYSLYLKQFTNRINNNNDTNTEALFEDYKKVYRSFSTDYPLALQYAIQFYLLSEIFKLWIDTERIYTNYKNIGLRLMSISSIIWKLFVLIMYTKPASEVSEHFCILQNKLDEYYDNAYKLHKLQSDDNYRLRYINKHKIIICLGNLIVTKKAFIKFVCVFILFRYISFTVRHF